IIQTTPVFLFQRHKRFGNRRVVVGQKFLDIVVAKLQNFLLSQPTFFKSFFIFSNIRHSFGVRPVGTIHRHAGYDKNRYDSYNTSKIESHEQYKRDCKRRECGKKPTSYNRQDPGNAIHSTLSSPGTISQGGPHKYHKRYISRGQWELKV